MRLNNLILMAFFLIGSTPSKELPVKGLGIGAQGILAFFPALSIRGWIGNAGIETSFMGIVIGGEGNMYGDAKILLRTSPTSWGSFYGGPAAGIFKNIGKDGLSTTMGIGMVFGTEILAFSSFTFFIDAGFGYLNFPTTYYFGPIGSIGVYWYP